MWTHLVFYVAPDGYHSGPLYQVISLHFLFYILLSLWLLFSRGKKLNRFEYYDVLAYNLLLLIGIIVRYLLPHVVIMNLFSLLAIMVQFLTFQNPDKNIDRRTKLFNRIAFETMLSELLETGKKRQILGVIIKRYGDNRELYGGIQMDAGLASIAEYLRTKFRTCRIYYIRSGEFLIGANSDVDLRKVQEEITSRFEQPWGQNGAELYLQPAFILENGSEHFDTVEQFMDCLETTYHQVDQVGTTDCVMINEEHKKEWQHTIAIRRAVENAIAQDRVEVYLQPIVDAYDHHLVGAEALARIIDPELGPIMPGDFITLAEKNGSIIEMGEQIYRKACLFMAKYGKQLNLQWININLSPIQCMDNNLSEDFVKIASEYGVSPGMLHLEITEQENVDQGMMNQQITRMTGRGFSFVLDDYGTGYSNIERIKKLPLINIKMDMSLVRSYFSHPDSVLPLSIEMVRNMGFSVTAEGVETADMAEKLTMLGCNYLQGYLFSKPLPMDAFLEKYLTK